MIRFAIFALALLTGFAAPAAASTLKAEQSVKRVVTTVNADGESVRDFIDAERIAPGDELKYVLDYANEASEAAENVRLVMPVPATTTYIEGSAVPGAATVEFSADGGVSFAGRDALLVEENGRARTARPEDITHVRWRFETPIPAGETGSVGFRAMLD